MGICSLQFALQLRHDYQLCGAVADHRPALPEPDHPFRWFVFDYTAPGSGGLGGFLGFLVAYVCAQVVNYIVQRKLVFGATVNIGKTIGRYILTVAVGWPAPP